MHALTSFIVVVFVRKCVDDPNRGSENASGANTNGKKKKSVKKTIKTSAPIAQKSFLEALEHELVMNKLFWIVWSMVMLAIIFFGFQWKSLNARLQTHDNEMEKIIALTNQIIETNLQLLKQIGESCPNK
jgi:hypothetical protein